MSNNRVIIGSVPGSVPGLRFFFAPLEPGPGRGAKIDNPLLTRRKKNKIKNLPGSLNSARV